MASLKLKVENREKLYNSKFKYKCWVVTTGASYTDHVKSLDEFERVVKATKTFHWRKVDLKECDLPTIDKIIKLRTGPDSKECAFRTEGGKLSVFTNNTAILKKIVKFHPTAELFEADVAPIGIKWFKRNPPAAGRVYFNSSDISQDRFKELKQYVRDTKGVRMSTALKDTVKYYDNPKSFRFGRVVYLYTRHYLDMDNESDMTMFMLKFSDIAGKAYRLVKKTT